MKSYNKIPHFKSGIFGSDCIAFDKLDGSNLRFEWSEKKGFYKFGSRNELIDINTPIYGKGIEIFLEKYSEDLDKIFRTKYPKVINTVVFAEFLGPNSFAGLHDEQDPKDVILFDVSPYKKGVISPYEFIENFGHLDIPNIVYSGKYTLDLVQDIKNNTELSEGVICKGIYKTGVWMAKIKTNKWIDRVRAKFGKDFITRDFGKGYEEYNF